MMPTCHIRLYREGDEAAILRLRADVFGDLDPVRLRPATWRWQFRRNPAGKAVCVLAEDRHRIVGQYAVIPTRFHVEGRETRFALSCDTMIHPDYRRQGLFTRLAHEVYRRIESDFGITTVWGFPNAVSLPGFTRRLDWHLITTFPLRLVPLRPLAMVRSLFPLKMPHPKIPPADGSRHCAGAAEPIPGIHVEPIPPAAGFETEFDALWEREQGLAPVIQVRDTTYLNWRYMDVPEFGYQAFAVRSSRRLLGYMVIRTLTIMGHFFGALTDVFPFPIQDPVTTRRLFRFARDYLRAEGAEFMTCLLTAPDPSFFKSVGLRTVPGFLNPRKWHFGARFSPIEAPLLSAPKNWYLTYGDTDMV